MTTRSAGIRAWCARAWRGVLHATQAIAGCDLTGQCAGGWLPQRLDIPAEWARGAAIAVPDVWWTLDPVGWAHCTRWALEPPGVTTEAAPRAATERPPALTSAEQARLRVLRDRYRANRTPFTTRELAHLQFMRWLHHTGRSTG
jgi:hypothetical protein